MKIMTAGWTIALTAAAIIAMPSSGFAQNAPPSQPPAAAQPATPPDQPPAQPPAAQANPSNDAAKAHLTAARNALSQITQLPAAAQLQGEARMHVSQLINNFNELITTQSDWKSSYAKVETNLNALLTPQPPAPDPARPPSTTPGAVGTTGTVELDPAIRAKLVEFKGHLTKFHDVASGASPAPAAPAATPDPAPATPTTPPANPTPTTPPPAAQTPPAGETPPTPQREIDDAPADPQEILAHVQAIEVIIGANASAQAAAQSAAGGAVGTTGTPSGSTRTTVTPSDVTLNQAQLQEIRTHLAELRRLLEKK
jgi:hypothetical protein